MNARTQSQFCTLSDYHYHIQSWGSAELPALVFLHGFMGSCRDFEWIMPALSAHFFCVGIDLPGHGQTQVLGDETCYGMEAIALSLTQVLDHFNLSPCHVLGYSMGGRVALYLAVHYPQYFRTVILESASPGLATETERRDRLKHDHAIACRLEHEDLKHFLIGWYSQPLFANLREHSSYEAMLQYRLQNDPKDLARSLRHLGLGQQPPLWSTLKDLSLPTGLMVGELDSKFVRLGQIMHQKIPHSTLWIVDQCGHSIHHEDPRRYAAIVHEYLQ